VTRDFRDQILVGDGEWPPEHATIRRRAARDHGMSSCQAKRVSNRSGIEKRWSPNRA
jgi:hypothetical protein